MGSGSKLKTYAHVYTRERRVGGSYDFTNKLGWDAVSIFLLFGDEYKEAPNVLFLGDFFISEVYGWNSLPCLVFWADVVATFVIKWSPS